MNRHHRHHLNLLVRLVFVVLVIRLFRHLQILLNRLTLLVVNLRHLHQRKLLMIL
jgi:hypothetical protein